MQAGHDVRAFPRSSARHVPTRPASRLVPWLSLVACFLCVPTEIQAQGDLVLAAAEVGEEKLLLQEIPSVFTASKYEQKVTQAPSSISIVTAEEIKRFGYRTLADILRSVRGFYVSYDRNYSYLGVRGFNRPGDYNSRILLMIDGHRLNDTLYDSALIGTEFPLDVDLIDRVEIVRGPSSSLYGNNAFFAVVNVISRRGREFRIGEVSGSVQRYDTFTGRVTFGHRFQNGVEGIVSGSFLGSEGKKRLYFPEFDDPTTNNGVAEGLDGDDAYQTFTTLAYRDFTFQGLYASRTKEIPTASYGTTFNAKPDETRDALGYADLKYESTAGTHWDILGRLYYDRYYYKGKYPYSPALNLDSGEGNRVGGEAQVTTRVLPRNIITSGAQADYSPNQDQKNYDTNPDAAILDVKNQMTHWGLFLQDELTIFPNLRLNAGVRYDKYEDFDGTVNPRIALIYNPLRDSIMKFVYGTAFRTPNVYERFYEAPGQKANPDLKPETISTYELILEQYLGGVVRLTAVPFHYDVKDLITQQTDPNDGLLVFRNVGHVTSRGVEVEAEAKWSNGWTARAAYTWQDAKDEDADTRLSDSPRHVAQFNLIAPLWPERLFGGLEVQYVGDRLTFGGTKVEGKVVTNLTLFSTDLLVKGLAASASVYNLFDTKVKNPVSDAHVMQAITQDGIGFRFKVTYTY
jgi:outer membrane receptor for ferrienterochelin and colicins